MKRREFLKSAGLMSLSMLMPGLNGWAYSSGNDSTPTRKLIIVLLRGAVDGLNVVVPYGDSHYYDLRRTIAIPPPRQNLGVLDLDGHFGLHPALEPLMPLWQERSIAFVHASGSPDATRSHFDAQDYMESGCPGVKSISTGWLNRLLTQIPSNKSPVRGVNFGATLPRIFEGPSTVATVALGAGGRKSVLDRPVIANAFSQMYGASDPMSQAFKEGMAARHQINTELDQAQAMNNQEQVMANNGAPLPQEHATFGKQMGELFFRDPTIQVAFVAFGGWDTHINQGAGTGQLANHLKVLGQGLADLRQSMGPVYQNTTILVMSEFGRTARENGNGGTDHGHGNAMWLLGGNIAGGKVYGRWGGLSQLYESRDVPVTTDFRTVISTVLKEHVGLSQPALAQIFPDFSVTDRSLSTLIRT